MSPTIGELLSVTVQPDPENSQKILCIDSCEQSSSPTIATYEYQALSLVFIYRNSSGIIGDVLLVATGEENLYERTKHFTR